METLKDFLSDLKERLSNPFLSSFVISWLICNYQIFIALFFYKLPELSIDGKITYFTIIEDAQKDNLHFWILPLIVALIYTFIIPYVKSGLKIYQAWILTGTDKRIYKVTDTSVVSIENHTKVSKDLKETKAQYADLIENESTYKNEIENLKTRVLELSEKHNETIISINQQHDKANSELALDQEMRINELQKKSKSEQIEILTDFRETKDRILDLENTLKLQRGMIEGKDEVIAELTTAKQELENKFKLNEEENIEAIMDLTAENNLLNNKVIAYNVLYDDLSFYLEQSQNLWINESNLEIDKNKFENLFNKLKTKLSNFKEVKNN